MSDYSEFEQDAPADAVVRDGVEIPVATGAEKAAFDAWAKRNGVNEPYHPDHHYDNVGAFRAGIDRAKGEEEHFPDTFKLPGHETFSDESKYATGANADFAGHWEGDKYTPGKKRYAADDYSEFEGDAPKAQPWNPGEYGIGQTPEFDADVGPPSDDVPEEARNPRGLGERVARGVLQEMPFADELGAAVEAPFRDEPILEAYRKARTENRSFWENERKMNGTAGRVAGAAGAMVPALTASAMLPGGVAATGAKAIAQGAALGGLTALDQSEADLTKGEVPKSMEDTVKGQAIGGAVAAVLPPFIKAIVSPVAALGKGLQLPVKAVEDVADRIGDSRFVKWLAGKDAATEGAAEFASKRAKDLERKIAAGESAAIAAAERPATKFAPEDKAAERLARSPTDAFDSRGNFSGGAELADDLAKMQDDVIQKNVAKHYPGEDMGRGSHAMERAQTGLASELESKIKFATKESEQAARDEAMKKTASDLAGEQTRNIKTPKRPPPSPWQDLPDDPTVVRPQVRGNDQFGQYAMDRPSPSEIDAWYAAHPEIKRRNRSTTDREWKPGAKTADTPENQALKFRAGSDDAERDASRQVALRTDLAHAKERQAKDVIGGATEGAKPPSMSPEELAKAKDRLKELQLIYPKFKLDTAEGIRAAEQHLATRAKEIERELIAGGRSSLHRRQAGKDAAKAKTELERINVGRKAIANVIGTGAGIAEGRTFGAAGALLGAATGKTLKLGDKVLTGIDMASALGQRLTKTHGIAERLADQDSMIGRAARWALDGTAGNAAARLTTLEKLIQDDPEARDEMGIER